MIEIEVIEDPATATIALDPVRCRLLAEMAEPASATTLAARVGLTRQKVSTTCTLEAHGLVKVAEERQWGGLTERLMVATAASYVVSPSALGSGRLGTGPGRGSAFGGLSHCPGRALIREVGALLRRSKELNKRLPTLSVDTEIRFRSAADRAAFSHDPANAVTQLVARLPRRNRSGRPLASPGGHAHLLPHPPKLKEQA